MQKYNNNPKCNGFDGVNGYVLAKINLETLKAMSKIGLTVTDWRYVGLFEEYQHMLGLGMKREAARTVLAERYKISTSSVKRVIRRMLKQTRL